MIFGGIACLAQKDGNARRRRADAWIAAMSFVLYFVVMKFGKGHTDWTYYIQLLGLVPVYAFVYHLFRFLSHPAMTRLATRKLVKPVVLFLSNLTLEIYLVQQYVITDAFNSLFPFNAVLVFLLICGAAYLLHVMVRLFGCIMNEGGSHWRDILYCC